MANYNSLKNAGLLKPVANTDLGSPTNTYGNLYMSGNVSLNGTLLNSSNAIAPRIASIAYLGDDTAANSAGGTTVTLTGSGFIGSSVYVGGTIAGSVSVVSSTQITFVAPVKAAGNYSLSVVNSDGATATFVPGIQYSGVPSWSTTAGSLATVYETSTIANTFSATSDSTVTYSVTSGSLPAGGSLNSATGALTGTASSVESSTIYNFTVRASDGENQDTDRNFSYTINPDVVTWSSPAEGATLTGTQDTAFSQELSATSAAGKTISYSANALPSGLSISGSSITGTPTVGYSSSSLITATAATTNKTATRTFNWNIQAPTYTITPASSSVNEGSALTFNVGGTNITNGTYYWSINNISTAAGDFSGSVTSGSFTITSNVGSFTVTATADTTTEGEETFTVSIRTGSTSGTIVATSSTVTINDTSLTYIPPTQRAIFGYGSTGDGVSMTNLVSDTGVVATDTTGVGTGRMELAAASYGGDKAIFGYGGNNSSYNQSRTNLVSNTGVVATDTTGVGTARRALAAAGYGGNKAIFGYGASVSVTAITNKVSSTGVVATDTAGVGTARQYLAAAGYGGDKAIFGYGWDGTHYSMTNLVTNTGVVGNDVTGVGTVRKAHGAAGYGGDKAIFGFGQTPGGGDYVYATNLVSNTGVVASDVTFVYYTGPGQTRTARGNYAAASYGGDKAIFGYGFNTSVTNLISNTGVLGIDRTGVGTARFGLAAAGYSST